MNGPQPVSLRPIAESIQQVYDQLELERGKIAPDREPELDRLLHFLHGLLAALERECPEVDGYRNFAPHMFS